MKKEVKKKSLMILKGVEIVFLSFAIVFLGGMLINYFLWEGNDFSFSEWWRWLKDKGYIEDTKLYSFKTMLGYERVFFDLKYFIYLGAALVFGVEIIRSFLAKKIRKIIILPILIFLCCNIVHWKFTEVASKYELYDDCFDSECVKDSEISYRVILNRYGL